MTRPRIVLLALVAAGALARGARAARAEEKNTAVRPKILEGVGLEQLLGQQVPLDLEFTDETGRAIRLADYFGRRPVILTLNYYDCPMLCTLELNGLVSALRTMSLTAGKDFDIVTVSIDPTEGSELAARKKHEYVHSYARLEAETGWHFLTGRQDQIERLAAAVGFHYNLDAATGEYAHAAGILVLTPDGRLSRYFYGVEFAPRDLRLALVESSGGKIGTLADMLLLFCYHYDPSEARYSLAALGAMRAGGAISLIGLAALVFTLGRKSHVV
jgi:protein SCO1/2